MYVGYRRWSAYCHTTQKPLLLCKVMDCRFFRTCLNAQSEATACKIVVSSEDTHISSEEALGSSEGMQIAR